jgi:hypothetical protein
MSGSWTLSSGRNVSRRFRQRHRQRRTDPATWSTPNCLPSHQLELADLEDPLAYLHGSYRSVGELADHS